MKVIFIALFALLLTQTFAVRHGCIRLYEHYNRRGKSALLCGTTNYNWFARHRWNDITSHVCAGRGADWVLWQHSGFKGRAIRVSAGRCINVPGYFNDQLSAVQKVRRRPVCRYVYRNRRTPYRSCRRVRVAPYTKRTIKNVRYYYNEPYKTRRRVRYSERVCYNQRYKVYYNKPYRTTRRERYRDAQRYRQYYNIRVPYKTTVPARRRVRYRKRVRITVNQRYRKPYRARRLVPYMQSYTARCSRQQKQYYHVNVVRPYRTTCRQRYRKRTTVRKRVRVRVKYRQRYWTGDYRPSGNNCFQKKMSYRPAYRWEWRVRRRPTTVWAWRNVSCIKRRTVKERRLRYKLVYYNCTKRRRRYKWHYYTAYRWAYRKVGKYVHRWAWKWQSYRRPAIKYRNSRRWRYAVRYVYRYRNRVVFKTRRAFRYAYRVAYKNVWKYKYVDQIKHRRRSAYRKVYGNHPVYKYRRTCTTRYRNVRRRVRVCS